MSPYSGRAPLRPPEPLRPDLRRSAVGVARGPRPVTRSGPCRQSGAVGPCTCSRRTTPGPTSAGQPGQDRRREHPDLRRPRRRLGDAGQGVALEPLRAAVRREVRARRSGPTGPGCPAVRSVSSHLRSDTSADNGRRRAAPGRAPSAPAPLQGWSSGSTGAAPALGAPAAPAVRGRAAAGRLRRAFGSLGSRSSADTRHLPRRRRRSAHPRSDCRHVAGDRRGDQHLLGRGDQVGELLAPASRRARRTRRRGSAPARRRRARSRS